MNGIMKFLDRLLSLLLSLSAVSLQIGCGGNAETSDCVNGKTNCSPGDGDGDGDGDGSDGDMSTTCSMGDQMYDDGDEVPGPDACTQCYCDEGEITCASDGCAPEPEEFCDLPFEAGPCRASIPVFWHNPATGECEQATYGGCDGNENRFEAPSECQANCESEPSGGASCVVDGVTYPDGATGVPDPTSCNECICVDGVVESCTEIFCPKECEEGYQFVTECVECGPTDACLKTQTICRPKCETFDDCSESGGACVGGACQNVCG
jgi:hypothetical protein